jgi:hypothetical protein
MGISVMWRRSVVVACAAAAISGGEMVSLSDVPVARADRIVNVYDLCNGYKPGYVPAVTIGTLGELKCIAPGSVPVALADDSVQGRIAPGAVPGLPPGSYKVNPFDLYSDWVIPG